MDCNWIVSMLVGAGGGLAVFIILFLILYKSEKSNIMGMPKDFIKTSTERQYLLAKTLGQVLVADGVVHKDAVPTTPELVAAAEEYVKWRTTKDKAS